MPLPWAKMHRYAAVDSDEDVSSPKWTDGLAEKAHASSQRKTPALALIALVLLAVSNVFMAVQLSRRSASSTGASEADCSTVSAYTGLDKSRIPLMEGYRRPEYMSHNTTEADAAWDAVNLGHGIVALDSTYATDTLHLPPSRRWKPDRSKYIYSVAAYHAMHCVPYLRRLIKTMHAGGGIEEDQFHHAGHCINVLREEIMCNADDALLTMPMTEDGEHRRPVGWRQERQCVDWKPLRDWSTEHSAGYLTYEDHPGVWHWGVNFPPTDGWLVD